ncbi:uncharacterized protein TNCV_1187731 [Trichonephila clavipes]|nr:uncharacterized protein TNCV_1187731 [Trichonephila clavipes]
MGKSSHSPVRKKKAVGNKSSIHKTRASSESDASNNILVTDTDQKLNVLQLNNRFITHPQLQADIFADYFASKNAYHEPLPLDFLYDKNNLLNKPFHILELHSAIKNSKNTTPGADHVTAIFCKNLDEGQRDEKTQNASTKTPIPPYPTHDDQAIDSLNPCPDKEPVLPRPDVNEIAATSRFLILSLTNTDMSKKSPFAIHKALIGIGGKPKSVKRLRSGDLLIETSSALQTKSFLLAKSFLDSPITISPHKTLNSCRGVISESDLLTTPDAEILDGFSDQDVIQVRRITIKKYNSVIPTKHLILTFNRPKLPTTMKAGYLNCKIRPYIPNPLRCFRCQRFGHSQTSCRGQLICSSCASAGHSSTDCALEPKFINCSQSHPSNSQLCPKWKLEKKYKKSEQTIIFLI